MSLLPGDSSPPKCSPVIDQPHPLHLGRGQSHKLQSQRNSHRCAQVSLGRVSAASLQQPNSRHSNGASPQLPLDHSTLIHLLEIAADESTSLHTCLLAFRRSRAQSTPDLLRRKLHARLLECHSAHANRCLYLHQKHPRHHCSKWYPWLVRRASTPGYQMQSEQHLGQCQAGRHYNLHQQRIATRSHPKIAGEMPHHNHYASQSRRSAKVSLAVLAVAAKRSHPDHSRMQQLASHQLAKLTI
mmetsp:Transcript_50249/g.117323  ORF Transcript_50249/g.117323 Transcript_50249/m.117323 type:complete len:242 (+) Transcript_50249:3337-4062(+)